MRTLVAVLVVSASRPGDGEFRVRPRCRGAIRDAHRIVQPTAFTDEATSRTTETTVEQRARGSDPFTSRDELRRRPGSAQ